MSKSQIKIISILGLGLFSFTLVSASEVIGNLNSSYTAVSNSLSGNVTAPTTINVTEPVITITANSTGTISLSVPVGVSNPQLDMSALVSGGQLTVPGTVETNTNTTLGQVAFNLPSGVVISSTDPNWDGKVNLPSTVSINTVTLPTILGTSNTVVGALEVGSTSTYLTFNSAIRIIVYGYGNSLPGYMRSGTFYEISTACTADNQATGDNLPADGDCYKVVGSDLVIWTKHFTTFAFYRSNASLAPAPSSGGGSSSGGGGGGGGSVYMPPIGITTTTNSTSSLSNIINTNKKPQKIAIINRRVKRGDEDIDVMNLQKILAIRGFLSNSDVIGYFGAKTETALKAYQKSKGLAQTGAVGPATLIVLNEETYAEVNITNKNVSPANNKSATTSIVIAITKRLSSGMSGEEVLMLQKLLVNKGFLSNDAVTGYFGNKTLSALKDYQASKGLDPVGSVGPSTMRALNSDMGTNSTQFNTVSQKVDFKIGDQNENVVKLQKLLIQKGYLNTSATGYYGPATDKAFKQYIKDGGQQ